MYSEDLVINAGNKRDKNEKEQKRMDGRRGGQDTRIVAQTIDNETE